MAGVIRGQNHFQNRGQWWTTGKKRALKRWVLTFVIGVLQAFVALSCNLSSKYLSKMKFDHVYSLLNPTDAGAQDDTVTDDLFQGNNDDATNSDGATINTRTGFGGSAFGAYLFYQTTFAALASLCLIEPVASGSDPEIKCSQRNHLPRRSHEDTLSQKGDW
jgi:hypothetical protein